VTSFSLLFLEWTAFERFFGKTLHQSNGNMFHPDPTLCGTSTATISSAHGALSSTHPLMDVTASCVCIQLYFRDTSHLPTHSQVTGMKAAGNNSPETVLRNFTKSTEIWGWPSRVRGDRGGENIMVATTMILKRGASRGSFMWGT